MMFICQHCGKECEIKNITVHEFSEHFGNIKSTCERVTVSVCCEDDFKEADNSENENDWTT